MAIVSFPLIIIVILLLVAFALKNWFLQYVKVSRAYHKIACPPNRLPFLGNILQLPINPHGESSYFTRSDAT